MKIGYYFPKIPVSRFRREFETDFIEWESFEGIEFIKSLFIKENLTLPKSNPNTNGNLESPFKSNEHFLLYIELCNIIKQTENLEDSLSKRYPENLQNRLANLITKYNNNEYEIIKDELFQTKLNAHQEKLNEAKNLTVDLIQNLKKKASSLVNSSKEGMLTHKASTFNWFWNTIENDPNEDILVKGFKITDETYEPLELYKELGYSNDLLEDDMKLLKELKANFRDNRLKILNTFYKVVRTNNPKDILYLSKERSQNNTNKIILVLKTHKTLKTNSQIDENMKARGSDLLFFCGYYKKPNTEILFKYTDSRYYGQNYGFLVVLDPETGDCIKSNSPILEKLNQINEFYSVLEGFKLSTINAAKQYKWVEPGKKGETCQICSLDYCQCHTILKWEKYLDPNISYSFDNSLLNPLGFKIERWAEKGYSIKKIYSIIGKMHKHNYEGYFQKSKADINPLHNQTGNQFSINWKKYNDQLDMDQQDPEFWE